MTFSLAESYRAISGPEAAAQYVAHHLFQSRGSCAYNRKEGGGLIDFLGDNVTRETARTDAVISVTRAMESIKNTQSGDRPADETVTGLQLLDVVVDGDVVNISLRIDLLSGNSFKSTFQELATCPSTHGT